MLRYLVWAIPSIGFIGTVRFGVALQRADQENLWSDECARRRF